MKNTKLSKITLYILLSILSSCITKFVPETTDSPEMIVVDGLLTDQPGPSTIKISSSVPLGKKSDAKPRSGLTVTITDNAGNTIPLSETIQGTYVTPSDFQGIIGRSYILHISVTPDLNYESMPMELKAVPPIDSVYYEKEVQSTWDDGSPAGEGCQIYLDTHDPENACKYFRWNFVETWDFKLPYNVANNHCWITNNSDQIIIKNTTSLSEDKIFRQPLTNISHNTDRLKEKYSILVSQYSLSHDEFMYWEKLQNITQDVGSIYDMIPSSIPSNIACIEHPDEKVLGYFSVSAVRTKRIFIKDFFRGMIDLYRNCANSSADGFSEIPGLGFTVWIIVAHYAPPPAYRILTFFKGCADCTVRGSLQKPSFWPPDK